jgi:hypothetical protein
VLNQGVQLRQAGCGEVGDGIRKVRERKVRLQDPEVAHVRVHDQLHTQTQTPAGKVHDEQRARKFHDSTGKLCYISLKTISHTKKATLLTTDLFRTVTEKHVFLIQKIIICNKRRLGKAFSLWLLETDSLKL